MLPASRHVTVLIHSEIHLGEILVEEIETQHTYRICSLPMPRVPRVAVSIGFCVDYTVEVVHFSMLAPPGNPMSQKFVHAMRGCGYDVLHGCNTAIIGVICLCLVRAPPLLRPCCITRADAPTWKERILFRAISNSVYLCLYVRGWRCLLAVYCRRAWRRVGCAQIPSGAPLGFGSTTLVMAFYGGVYSLWSLPSILVLVDDLFCGGKTATSKDGGEGSVATYATATENV
jgi:hypothetical protein